MPSREADCDVEVATGVLASRSALLSDTRDFARSLSAAFSRAARGAAGKYLANPAPDALGAILREV